MIAVVNLKEGPSMTPEELESLERWARKMHTDTMNMGEFQENGVSAMMATGRHFRSTGHFFAGYLFAAEIKRERGTTVVLFLVDVGPHEGPFGDDVRVSGPENRVRTFFEMLGFSDVLH